MCIRDRDKEKALKITTDQIEQKFGKGSIMKLGESTNLQVGVIPVSYTHLQPRTLLDERAKRDIASVALIILAIALFATVLFSANGVVTGALAMALRFSLGIGTEPFFEPYCSLLSGCGR